MPNLNGDSTDDDINKLYVLVVTIVVGVSGHGGGRTVIINTTKKHIITMTKLTRTTKRSRPRDCILVGKRNIMKYCRCYSSFRL